jgi:hypothetical protein
MLTAAMRARLALPSALAAAFLAAALAGAQPSPSPLVKVLVVGGKVTSIIDDADYSVLATVPHPAGDAQGWWPVADGSRATFVFQAPQKGFKYQGPARLQVLDLTENRAIADLPALEPRGSIVLPGPVAAVFWNADQTLLYALDQGVESKHPERVQRRRVYVIDPAAGTLWADLDLGPPSAAWDGDTIGVLPAPDYGRFYVLEKQGIAVLDGAGFRNILVHDYLRLDPDRVEEALDKAPEDFDDFARVIRRWLEGRTAP